MVTEPKRPCGNAHDGPCRAEGAPDFTWKCVRIAIKDEHVTQYPARRG